MTTSSFNQLLTNFVQVGMNVYTCKYSVSLIMTGESIAHKLVNKNRIDLKWQRLEGR